MNCYVAELDETQRILAIWVKPHAARTPSIFDPEKHVFDPHSPNEFVGAPKREIMKWLTTPVQTPRKRLPE